MRADANEVTDLRRQKLAGTSKIGVVNLKLYGGDVRSGRDTEAGVVGGDGVRGTRLGQTEFAPGGDVAT